MRILIFLTIVSLASADPVLLTQPDGTLYGPHEAPSASADRKVPFDKSLMPLEDLRGCCRWRKVGDRIEKIPEVDRRAPFEARLQAYREWMDVQLILELQVADDPEIQAALEQEAARLEAIYRELARPGEAKDEPVEVSR